MRSLRAKILALAVFLVLFTQAGTIATVLVTSNRDVAVQAHRRLESNYGIIGLMMPQHLEDMRRSIHFLSDHAGFATALNDGDLAEVRQQLHMAQARNAADVVFVMDDGGTVLSGSDGLAAGRTAFPGLAEGIRQGRSRDVLRINGGTFEVVSVPVPGARQPRWIVMGQALDDARARLYGRLSGLNVAFLDLDARGTQVLGTSFAGAERRAMAATDWGGVVAPGKIEPLTVGGSQYLAVSQPLPGSDRARVVLLESLDQAFAPYRTLRQWVMGLGALALLVALAGAAVVAGALTRPVGQLAAAARRIREGDYARPVAVAAGGELTELAAAINTMQEGIAEREQRISWHARFDALTGLPNRLQAQEELAAAMARCAAAGAPLTVLVVDLGDFREVATSLGHEISAALLSQAAERLRGGVDARHLVARIESDEFFVLLEGEGLGRALATADELLRVLGAGQSFRDVNISVEGVIGIATFPEHGTDPEQLLVRAGVARNDARRSDQRVHVYQDGREERRMRQLAILGDLRRAARNDEFRLFLQPKVLLRDGTVCGAEALVRWDHPALGWLPPGEFIPVAEQSGNISVVTHWALTAAVRECRLWLEEGLRLPVSVNVSGRDLANEKLPVFIFELLRDHDLDAGLLCLEVTEQALVRDAARATLVLQCLRDLGVRISIDDFGTGYSSLAQLKTLPVDEVKIDRSFVMGLPDNREDAAIVRAAVDLAHDLGLEVVAEGVESVDTQRWLAALGCERAQGFWFSRPMPAAAFVGWVNRYTGQQTVEMPSPLLGSRSVSARG
jgi:diguanylate cyclase (GGDEF)-like protein